MIEPIKSIKPILISEKKIYEQLEHLLPRKYALLTIQQSKEVNRLIILEMMNIYPNVQSLIKKIMKNYNVTYNYAELIVRTEITFLQNFRKNMKELFEDSEERRRYIWFGPNDDRTTPICKEIKQRTAKGVKLNELRRIIIEVAKKYLPGFDTRNGIIPHFNCRHTFLRVR